MYKYATSIDTTYFPNTQATIYWSSTSDATYWNIASVVYFSTGSVLGFGNKSGGSYYVRCVRGGQSGSTTTTTDNCAAITSGPPGTIQIPFISYASGYYSGVLTYQPANTSGIWFAMGQFTEVSTPNCTTPATLSNGTLTIPKLTLTTSSGAVVNSSVTLYCPDVIFYQVTNISDY